MSFTPYLSFSGQAREAMTAYAEIFGSTDLQIMSFGDAPPGAAPAGFDALVMHSQLSTGANQVLMAADMPGNDGAMSSPSIFHSAKDAATATAVFNALAVGGHVIMPLGKTFWSDCFGMVKDRFGTSWLISLVDGAA